MDHEWCALWLDVCFNVSFCLKFDFVVVVAITLNTNWSLRVIERRFKKKKLRKNRMKKQCDCIQSTIRQYEKLKQSKLV